tara:strand:+ start:959 stop:1324 length:366 start_codon:yes stop_codon:yes gene_type:complete
MSDASPQHVEGPSEGLSMPIDDSCRSHMLEWASTYRGDVSITTTDGTQHIGYLFDQTDDFVRMDPTDGSARVQISAADIMQLHFSGRDTAAGKSFDRWIARYVDKTLAGEEAGIDSESLDS